MYSLPRILLFVLSTFTGLIIFITWLFSSQGTSLDQMACPCASLHLVRKYAVQILGIRDASFADYVGVHLQENMDIYGLGRVRQAEAYAILGGAHNRYYLPQAELGDGQLR